VASQFHPEFKSRPDRPHPLFAGFVKAAIEHAGASVAEPSVAEPSVAEPARISIATES
jgi:CTP synthase